MKTFSRFLALIASLLLSSCLYDHAPSRPASQINTALVGTWTAQDQHGRVLEAKVTPMSNLYYHISCYDKDKNEKNPWQFEGWISRVDDLKLLTLRSLSSDRRYQGKYLLFHYEVIAPGKAPVSGIGAPRVRITQLQLDLSARHLDPKALRQAIREELNQQRLLLSEGSAVWTKIEDVAWKGEKNVLRVKSEE
jgi:hypothetical protein